MKSIVFEGDTWERYEDLRTRDGLLHRKLCAILKEMQRGDPAVGTGKPWSPKRGLSGLWSRRLSDSGTAAATPRIAKGQNG